jgi:hypothetical protein
MPELMKKGGICMDRLDHITKFVEKYEPKERSCRTCEWNFGDKCASVGELGEYGSPIKQGDLAKDDRKCWEIGFEYYEEIAEKRKLN